MPVTVKQLLEATQAHPDAKFKIDDVEVGLITFVGVVRNVSVQSTNATYRIEDGSGIIDVKHWIDPERAQQEIERLGIEYVGARACSSKKLIYQ